MLSQATHPPRPDFSLQEGPVAEAWRSAPIEIKSLKIVMIIRKSLEFVLLRAAPGFEQSLGEP